jgi:dTDP-4-amino-4,6-dideoxygalactose transaminase
MDQYDKINLVDLKAQYLSIRDEIDKAIEDCISDADFVKGKSVGEFEYAFARYIGRNFCISCGNGTDALELILKGLNIGAGDEVLVPALTWIATAEAVNNAGAEPVFVDIKLKDYTIDPDQIENKISKKTKAIIPVHLYGCPCDMDRIKEIAEKHGLFIIEDCAQAHGAEFEGEKVGSFGIASAFSFFPSKNLGAFGDGGAVITDEKELADKVRMIANHGQLHIRHSHMVVGRNSRLDTIQAAILNVKLKYLDQWNLNRISAASHYFASLGKCDSVILPEVDKRKKHVFHLFVIRVTDREKLIERLREQKIMTGIHYPKPLPFLDAYAYKGHNQSEFLSAFKITQEVLSLPMYPDITFSQIEVVCNAIIPF